ncbi:uncharacterized protein EV420DRAFT_1646863 [Desarmillaria tabescens]|uniref:Uncharacterized protein n=1 Tax=Armillaria tabescens TaxID=1929756 RepID=A0AA39MWT5_ARMTA|nr:uncharacterized protein EV420DRAFT_1646863 [Desarmillaria tabescens]KAK0449537.1 hypothetical protein EV420DRAFT_1646863 [Desarmillaria tabescens]
MSAPETKFAPTQSSSVLGGQIVGRTPREAAPPAALKLRLDLNLEVEIAIQAKVNGDITLSLLKCAVAYEEMVLGVQSSFRGGDSPYTSSSLFPVQRQPLSRI